MDTGQIQILRQSYSLIEPMAETVASLFYSRLFALDPSLRQLFTNDLKVQGKNLMSSIKLIVASLDNRERIIPFVRALGKRHMEYGVKPEHYATVGEALLWALEKSLGQAYTPEVEAAWVSAYGFLSDLMQEAASEVTQTSTLWSHPGYA